MEARRLSGVAETSVLLYPLYSLSYCSESGEVGALDLGQREGALLLVDRLGADCRVVARASLGQPPVESRFGCRLVCHAYAGRGPGCFRTDDSTGRVSGRRA